MSNPCMSCQKAIFDPLWGEYRCLKKQHIIYTMPIECSDYASLLEGEKVPIAKDTQDYMEDIDE